MSWLLRDGDVLAAVEERRPGGPINGAVVLRPPFLLHTLPGKAALDVAWCGLSRTGDGTTCLQVRRIRPLGSGRVARPGLGRTAAVVADRGAFDRWNLEVGDCLEIRAV